MKTRIAIGFVLNLYVCSVMAIGKVTLFEDLLYWHPSQQTSSLWVTVQPIANPPGYTYPVPNVTFKWSPGLRLGVDYTATDLIDLKLYGTTYSSKANESVIAPPNHILIPTFFNGLVSLVNPLVFNQAQMQWKIRLNMIDAEVGSTLHPLDTLSIRPFIGIKGGTINQSIHSNWQAQIAGIDFYTATEDVIHNFYGIGPSFGVDSVWDIYTRLKINASLSSALLWGHWNIKDTFSRPAALLIIPGTTIISDTPNSMLGAFMLRAFMGLEWSFKSRTFVAMKAGYEMQFWANQLRLPLYEQLPVRGDLTLQGITCGISIDL
jgi:hypothetical protein